MVPPQTFIMVDGSRYAWVVVENTRRNGGVINLASYRRDGTQEFRKAIPFTGEPAPARVRDSLIGAEDFRGRSDGPANSDRQFQAIARERMPSFYPPIVNARFGLDGSLWLTVRVVDNQQSFRVLDTRGTEIGRVTLPKGARLSQATLTTLWVIQRDEDDLPSVVRYRLRWD